MNWKVAGRFTRYFAAPGNVGLVPAMGNSGSSPVSLKGSLSNCSW